MSAQAIAQQEKLDSDEYDDNDGELASVDEVEVDTA